MKETGAKKDMRRPSKTISGRTWYLYTIKRSGWAGRKDNDIFSRDESHQSASTRKQTEDETAIEERGRKRETERERKRQRALFNSEGRKCFWMKKVFQR